MTIYNYYIFDKLVTMNLVNWYVFFYDLFVCFHVIRLHLTSDGYFYGWS